MGTRPSWVRTDTFFAMDGEDKIVGIIDLRHTLNDFLADLGNCGCSVRPSQRQKGYAGQMLGQVLDRAKEVGLTALYISVERENLPSVKVIKRNGGVYQRSFTHEGQQADIYAFRI
ncbi:GNAT family N-acetyltransferase [Acutalibacter intestini]|uniref:GNAT family N-acetyltransferase n=1 Tax=Acutalibacter intestini TaxID=3093659 RepID=UPI002AC89C0F|nr:GNAT family N-acetyltransferase [Acutalibacter sp. M00204]